MKIFNVAAITAMTLHLLGGSAQTRSMTNPIEGTWILQSVYEEDDGGEELDRWGRKPTGGFIADPSGHFSFQLVGRNAIRVGTASSSPACGTKIDREALAYTGTYRLDPELGRMALRIEDATSAQWDQNHANVWIEIGPDRLDFVSSAETSPTGAFYTHLVFRRAN